MSGKVKIEIRESTRDKMRATGKMGDTYDSMICDMLSVYYTLVLHRAEQNITADASAADTHEQRWIEDMTKVE